jgi:DNA repair protein RecO (recombination protein O)
MNNFSDQGIVLSVRPHGEGGAVVHILSEHHGKCGGYVNGAQSSARLKSMLQTGNIVSFEWQSKAEGQLGRFDLELETDIATSIMDTPKAITAVQSACGLIDMFLPDREVYASLYHGTNALLQAMKGEEWPAIYIVWEMAFLKELGYGIDLSKCAVSGAAENLTHISPKTGRAVCAAEAEPYIGKLIEIPRFLQGQDLANDDIEKGLKMTGYFLVHRLLQHSSFTELPNARSQLSTSFDVEN